MGEHEREPRDARDEDAERTANDDEPQAGEGSVDISDTTAPSVGPNTVIEKDDPEERLSRHEQSNTDAMGLDKRRSVIGGQYSPSFARQATMYGVFIAVLAALVIGGVLAAKELDQPPEKYPDKAPWSQADAEQVEPRPVDFPRYGEPAPELD